VGSTNLSGRANYRSAFVQLASSSFGVGDRFAGGREPQIGGRDHILEARIATEGFEIWIDLHVVHKRAAHGLEQRPNQFQCRFRFVEITGQRAREVITCVEIVRKDTKTSATLIGPAPAWVASALRSKGVGTEHGTVGLNRYAAELGESKRKVRRRWAT
jgi:hypothetical protein